ncbi:F-box only protein 15 isoform X2 [Electrophorus electricus]|uniref:F-box only protein 15 isoform X2 n=1 Tax=Electrophorus electricus TaxID=8005 RepID=UPI0015D02FB4|nr:F-box only protein 15 isoform X2 [Electrophorus electricus]
MSSTCLKSQRLTGGVSRPSSTVRSPGVLPGRFAKRNENFIERMPPEVLLKILSWLDAGSLFCVGLVNKRFQELASNNALWYQLYTCQQAKNKRPTLVGGVTDGMGMTHIEEKPKGYWRRLLFKDLTGHSEKWRKKLKAINYYTGLPNQSEQVLRTLPVAWEIKVTEATGRESSFEQTGIYYADTSVTVSWSAVRWPRIDRIASLQLHGVMRVPLTCPRTYRPGWRSLLATVALNKCAGQVYASDRLVELLFLDQGVTVGVWQEPREIAFIMVNLHYHRLVERSLLGSSTAPYHPDEDKAPSDDVDPEYGLHGYTLHIEMHNTVKKIASARFDQLFCRKDQIVNGYVQLSVISRGSRWKHVPVSGSISLPWMTEALRGRLEGCCMMALTVLDEIQTPFWCFSGPVSMTESNQTDVSYDYRGKSYFIQRWDSEGKVEIELQWVEEEKQYFMVNLLIFLPVSKVNKHFGRDY